MKNITNRFLGKGFLIMAVASGIFITGCSNSDYNKEGSTTATPATDTTALVSNDTAMNSSSMVNKDTTTAMSGAVGKDSTAKAKKGKKGKVSIVMTEATTGNKADMEADNEGFYKNTEVLPAFPGGQKALEHFFENNIQYPEAATENGVEGTVKLIFNVDENGKIYQPLPVGDKIGYGIEDEAIRVFNKMPKWTPGKIKGKNVKTRFTLPIKFQLG